MRRYWMLACAFLALLAGCAKAGGPGSMSEGCEALKRQQTAMVAEGRQNTEAYRRILDAYLARCHR